MVGRLDDFAARHPGFPFLDGAPGTPGRCSIATRRQPGKRSRWAGGPPPAGPGVGPRGCGAPAAGRCAAEAVPLLETALGCYSAAWRGAGRRPGAQPPAVPGRPAACGARQAPEWPELTESEFAVVSLVARGATNREVADRPLPVPVHGQLSPAPRLRQARHPLPGRAGPPGRPRTVSRSAADARLRYRMRGGGLRMAAARAGAERPPRRVRRPEPPSRGGPRRREPRPRAARRGGRRQDGAAGAPAAHAPDCQVARAAASSRRWSSRSRRCISCARRCSTAERLPAPQRDALRTAFGLSAGPAPDRFLVGLAVLSLLAEWPRSGRCCASSTTRSGLTAPRRRRSRSSARRLVAEPVGLVFAAREPGERSRGAAGAAGRRAARRGCAGAAGLGVAGPLDERVRDRIVAETRGNPLALLELPRGLTPAELAGGFGLPGARPLAEPDRGELPSGGSRPCPARPGGCCCWRRPSRPATRRWCGGRPGGSGSEPRRPRPRPRPGWPSRRAGAVPSSAGPLGGLPRGVGRRTGSGVHAALAEATDPRARSRSPRLAPGAGGAGRGRGGRRRARALGRPRAGPRRAGGGGRVPGTRGRADARSGAPGAAGAGRGRGQAPGRRARRGAGTCWPRPRPGRWTSSQRARGGSAARRRSRSP